VPLYLLDTDHLTHLRNGHLVVAARVTATPPGDIAACVISVEEQLDGWYKLLRQKQSKAKLADTYRRLGEAVKFFADVRILPLTEMALERTESLEKQKLNVKKNDLRIAAIALEHGAVVVTANARDFARVPGLAVEDWTQPAP
jgi:tRNA(fMet)-specific endonuclease VapC